MSEQSIIMQAKFYNCFAIMIDVLGTFSCIPESLTVQLLLKIKFRTVPAHFPLFKEIFHSHNLLFQSHDYNIHHSSYSSTPISLHAILSSVQSLCFLKNRNKYLYCAVAFMIVFFKFSESRIDVLELHLYISNDS